ncbi:DUF1493 family protein [Sphingobacterium siyangense]|uniref:DUF1493 family protein n=1 Tax=Sphingobacterium siyangense TaxID=459529 RepID=UPI0019650BE9|nr:DUF1493 family protein [Sphingobacterium siyangense]QRY57117.1 DUF1493 family protein [Sphingobacterium siyangense]
MNTRLRELLQEYSYSDVYFSADARLYHDLNIFGDDASEFLNAFKSQFNVNLSEFNFSEYFPSEGDNILPNIFRFLIGKKKKIYKPLTIYHLIEAIELGYLK